MVVSRWKVLSSFRQFRHLTTCHENTVRCEREAEFGYQLCGDLIQYELLSVINSKIDFL